MADVTRRRLLQAMLAGAAAMAIPKRSYFLIGQPERRVFNKALKGEWGTRYGMTIIESTARKPTGTVDVTFGRFDTDHLYAAFVRSQKRGDWDKDLLLVALRTNEAKANEQFVNPEGIEVMRGPFDLRNYADLH